MVPPQSASMRMKSWATCGGGGGDCEGGQLGQGTATAMARLKQAVCGRAPLPVAPQSTLFDAAPWHSALSTAPLHAWRGGTEPSSTGPSGTHLCLRQRLPQVRPQLLVEFVGVQLPAAVLVRLLRWWGGREVGAGFGWWGLVGACGHVVSGRATCAMQHRGNRRGRRSSKYQFSHTSNTRFMWIRFSRLISYSMVPGWRVRAGRGGGVRVWWGMVSVPSPTFQALDGFQLKREGSVYTP